MSYSSFLILLDKNPHIQFVDFLIADLNGIFRGKRYPVSMVENVIYKGMKLPLSVLGVDIWGQDVVDSGMVFETGDGDGVCWPVAPVRIPYKHPDDREDIVQSNIAEILLMMSYGDGKSPFLADSRQILLNVLSWYEEHQLHPVIATELEFYLFDKDDINQMKESVSSDIPMEARQMYSIEELDKLTPFLNELYAVCERQQIPIETAISESGAGQFEINLQHSNNIIQVADQTIIFKHIVKQVAEQHNLIATFMAKPKSYDAGNGLHVHTSVCDAKGNNIFDAETPHGEEKLKNAIAGCLQAMNESMLVFAPHRNSYRRFNEGTHAPITISWGYDNRTSSIRVPESKGIGARFEHRVSGADCNPYLVIAAVLSGMAYGLENQLKACQPVVGNAYDTEENCNALITNWPNAIEAFEESSILKKYMGELFIDIFGSCKRQELNIINQYISPFEIQAYLKKV